MGEKPVALWVMERFPHSSWYSTARPVGLMAQHGIDVHVLAGRQPEDRRESVDGVPIHRAGSLLQQARVVRSLRPQALFLESPCGELLLAPLCLNTWARTPEPSPHALKRRLQQVAAGRLSSLSVTNPHDSPHWPTSRARDDVPYPVDVALWSSPVARDPSFWTNRGAAVPTGPVLGYVSNILPRKAQVELVAWLAPLLTARPDLSLAIAGNPVDPAYAGTLERVARDLGPQVVLLGGLEPEGVRQLLSWLDIHVVNTTAETQCMAVFESLAAGVPTLLRDIPVLTEAFPLLPSHATGEALRANVGRLLDDPAARQVLLASSQQRLAWADVRRHDALVLQRCAEWGLL